MRQNYAQGRITSLQLTQYDFVFLMNKVEWLGNLGQEKCLGAVPRNPSTTHQPREIYINSKRSTINRGICRYCVWICNMSTKAICLQFSIARLYVLSVAEAKWRQQPVFDIWMYSAKHSSWKHSILNTAWWAVNIYWVISWTAVWGLKMTSRVWFLSKTTSGFGASMTNVQLPPVTILEH